jgi:hypothetical protein
MFVTHKSFLLGATIVGAVACTAGLLALQNTRAFAQTTLSAQPANGDRCAALAGLHLDNVEIVSANVQPANAPVSGAVTDMGGDTTPPVSGLPSFCRVVGKIRPEADSDISFEVWMPSEGWDGRLHGAGNGGFAGAIDYTTLADAVAHGQAGAATDDGHRGTAHESAWAKGHPARIRDYGWRAIHLTAVAAKEIVANFYGRKPDHSYFASCSNGGREALMEAYRFPEDYDGISAGSPAAVWSSIAMSMIWTVQAQLPAGAAIRPEQAKLLQSEVLKQCDASDGQSDGLVSDPRTCKFDVSKLACGANASAECFSPEQIVALKKIYAGPHDSHGRLVAPAYSPSGAEVGFPAPGLAWDSWVLGDKNAPAQDSIFAAGILENFVGDSSMTVSDFDWDKDPARLTAAVTADVDAHPEFKRYFARGGKLIIWQGWADGAIPPAATIKFYETALHNSGASAKSAMRLFMVPGLQHCFGGTGPVRIGQFSVPASDTPPTENVLAALQDWVENGRTPDALTGTFFRQKGAAGTTSGGAATERKRLICAFPGKAVLSAGQDPDKATSYSCHV